LVIRSAVTVRTTWKTHGFARPLSLRMSCGMGEVYQALGNDLRVLESKHKFALGHVVTEDKFVSRF